MEFGLRMSFVDVICDNSLKNVYVNGNVVGYEFDVRLAYYRGLYLSCIDVLEVFIDGEKVLEDTIRFGINEKQFAVCQLKHCYTEFWGLLDPANITVLQPGGLAPGEHKVELKLILRIPYMPLGDNHQYMPLISSGEKKLQVQE